MSQGYTWLKEDCAHSEEDINADKDRIRRLEWHLDRTVRIRSDMMS